MKKLNFSKNQILSLLSLAIVIFCYAGEKAFKRLTPWSNTSALIQAFVFTLAVAAVYLILVKAKDPYFGLISGIFAFKILPPNIEMLEAYNLDAACVYFIVRKMALVLFLYVIYRLYISQSKEENHIRQFLLPRFCLLCRFLQALQTTLSIMRLSKPAQ